MNAPGSARATGDQGSAAIEMPLAVALLLLTAACAPSHDAQCAALKDTLNKCIGSRVSRLDCASVSDADLNRLSDLTQGFSCALIAQSLPADGDLLSLTCRLGSVGCVTAGRGSTRTTRARERALRSAVSPGNAMKVPLDCSPAMTSAACSEGVELSIKYRAVNSVRAGDGDMVL